MSEQPRLHPRLDDPPLDVVGGWTTVYNISLGGMCVVTSERFVADQRVRFTLRDRETEQVMDFRADVVWASELVSGIKRAGVRWVDLLRHEELWLSRIIDRGLATTTEPD